MEGVRNQDLNKSNLYVDADYFDSEFFGSLFMFSILPMSREHLGSCGSFVVANDVGFVLG